MKRVRLMLMAVAVSFFSWNSVYAQYSGGSGTAADPYQIATVADLVALGANTGDYGKCFILKNSITIINTVYHSPLLARDKSGTSGYQGTPFTGVFDGNHQIISGLRIEPYDPVNYDYCGLFGCLGNGAQVKNLGLLDIAISGSDYIGGLCGLNQGGQIESCYAIGTINGQNYVGGLCGENQGGTLVECYSTVIVTGSGYAIGGLIGNNNGPMNNCSAFGQVSGSSNTGGLTGTNDGVITRCQATGDVSAGSSAGGLIGVSRGSVNNCFAVGDVTSVLGFTGGLVGYNYQEISFSYASGSVKGGMQVGGLCGINSSGTILSSYAVGKVDAARNSGGLCGKNFKGLIKECYATGIIIGSNVSCGGLCGITSSSDLVTGSFWDIETSGKTTSAGGTGLTTLQMQTQSMFTTAGWDFSGEDGDPADWIMIPQSYPAFTWSMVTIPDVAGLLPEDVPAVLEEAGLQMGLVTYTISEMVPTRKVISQFPPAGTVIPRGGSINIVVSMGWPYAGGSGTSADPYQITMWEDLYFLSLRPMDWGKCFLLTADINLAGRGPGAEGSFSQAIISPDGEISPSSWTFEGTAFTGIFDGGNHRITNLMITDWNRDYLGLFGKLGPGSQVKNLIMENIIIKGRHYAGAVCGYNDNGEVINCFARVNLQGYGFHDPDPAEDLSSGYMGGVCGYNKGLLERCSANGWIYCGFLAGNIGGLCGYNQGVILHSQASCSIEEGIEVHAIGGLCGRNENIIDSCYAAGYVVGTHHVGGLCGINQGNISSSYAAGIVGGGLGWDWFEGAVSDSSSIGGLCGSNSKAIDNCYSYAEVYGNSDTGGLCGSGSSELITKSFWDISSSRQTTSAGGAGKTTLEMQTLATFTAAGWDFTADDGNEADWKLVHPGEDYPRLAWQEEIAGDVAGLWGVDVVDLAALAAEWQSANPVRGDINQDGVVNLLDFALLSEHWLAGN